MSPGKPVGYLRIRGSNGLIISMESGNWGTTAEYFTLCPYYKSEKFIHQFLFRMPDPFKSFNTIRESVRISVAKDIMKYKQCGGLNEWRQ